VKGAPLLLVLGAGCAMTPPTIGEPGAELPDRRAEASYQAALERATGHREVYSGLDTRLFAAATYQSPEFREARLRRQAKFQSWPEARLDEEIARERADAAQVHEVVFGLSLVDRKFDDLDSRNSIWRLSLTTDRGEVTPLTVRRIGRANQDTRAYYPYMGDFWSVYTARFPVAAGSTALVGPGTKTLVFRLSSTQGQVELSFPVGGTAAPPVPTPSPQPEGPTSG
jgi:hypothetical protein